MAKVVVAKILINNMPEHPMEGFVVARKDSIDLWYYGTYETQEKAEEVAETLGNGIVVQVI